MKKKCEYCKKTIVPIGTKRRNGKYNLKDWDTRKYHKKCWAIVEDIKFYQDLLKEIILDVNNDKEINFYKNVLDELNDDI